jgi:hypothetical protein
MRNQILHIFRKDVRHHWPEIAVSWVALVAYGWHQSAHLNPWYDTSIAYEFLLSLLSGLLPLVWIFLMIRVVHGENLVGDRQFWVTRPYEWKKLLAAKLLFIVAFVNLPLFLVQIFLLIRERFPVAPHIPALLWVQLLWLVFVILPAVTLATVTTSTGQLLLVLLGGVLGLIAAVAVLRLIPNTGVVEANGLPSSLGFLVFIIASLAVVLWQYVRRRTAGARVVLLSAAVSVFLIFAATPYRKLINHLYPQPHAAQQLPLTLAFDAAKPAALGSGYPEKNKVHVRIPLLVSGMAEDSQVLVAGKMVSIQSPDGQKWTSNWYGSGENFVAGVRRNQTTLTIDKDFFERVKPIPVNVRITFALLPKRAREATRIVAQAGGFSVPGEGRCSFSPIDPNAILCVFPVKGPSLLFVAKAEDMPCFPKINGAAITGFTLYGQTWGFEGADNSEISPIRSTAVYWHEVFRACPGTLFTVYSNWEYPPRFRDELEIDGIKLADYQLKDSVQSLGEAGVGLP